MSEEKALCSHHLTIRFEQLAGNRVNWRIIPDNETSSTKSLSLVDLAELGAPLSLMAIQTLWKMCADGLLHNSLEVANSIGSEVEKRLQSGGTIAELDHVPEGATIN